MDNKRRFSRVTFSVNCTLSLQNRELAVSLVDLALKGALVEAAEPVAGELQAPCTLTIALDGLESPLQFNGEVRHLHGQRVGIKFTATDIDSMIHLRSIIESNTGNPEKVSDELSFLIDPD